MVIVIQRLEDDQYRKELRATLGDERYRTAVTEQLLQEYQNDVFLQCVRWLDSVYGGGDRTRGLFSGLAKSTKISRGQRNQDLAVWYSEK